MKLNLCCGGNVLVGWHNEDLSMDITHPLPLANETCTHVLIEHGLEHVTPQQAWNCLAEIHRVLIPGGVARVCIPDIKKIWRNCTVEYLLVANVPTDQMAVRAAIFNHGHQGIWTQDLLATVMEVIGFSNEACSYGESQHRELAGVDGHHKVVGLENARLETGIVEGTK